MKAVIDRIYGQHQALGKFTYGDFACKTLELPWRDNQRNVSCIPEGEYVVRRHQSPKFGQTFIILEKHGGHVSGRKWILIHQGNYVTDIRGCILVGNDFHDINQDGLKDVVNSKATMAKMLDLLPESFELKIREWKTENLKV